MHNDLIRNNEQKYARQGILPLYHEKLLYSVARCSESRHIPNKDVNRIFSWLYLGLERWYKQLVLPLLPLEIMYYMIFWEKSIFRKKSLLHTLSHLIFLVENFNLPGAKSFFFREIFIFEQFRGTSNHFTYYQI